MTLPAASVDPLLFGLPNRVLALIRGVLARQPGLHRARVYGSRAKGHYRPGSDIDIMLDAPTLTHNDLATLATALDDLMLPYCIDLGLWHHIDNPALLDHIERVGLTLWASTHNSAPDSVNPHSKMTPDAPLQSIQFKGQPCIRLRLLQGDTATIALHGAHVVSWLTADGQERLYLSPAAHFDGHSAIRGGVPLCFPQFNQRVLAGQALPKHGFARTLPWALQRQDVADDGVSATLVLTDSSATHALWPHAFAAELTVCLRPGSLRIGFAVRNLDTQPWPFALALHTYLQVDDVARTALHGLQGHTLWDAVTHLNQPAVRSQQAEAALTFSGETDRVYGGVTAPVRVPHPGGTVALSQSPNLPELVVWNPGQALCSTLRDMPAGGWRHMLCVEAACIDTPVVLAPGQRWDGWQQLSVLPAQ